MIKTHTYCIVDHHHYKSMDGPDGASADYLRLLPTREVAEQPTERTAKAYTRILYHSDKIERKSQGFGAVAMN